MNKLKNWGLTREGVVTQAYDVPTATEVDVEALYNGDTFIIFCISDGDVVIESANSVQVTKAMVAGEYWKFSPTKILAGSTATIQLHK